MNSSNSDTVIALEKLPYLGDSIDLSNSPPETQALPTPLTQPIRNEDDERSGG